MIPGVTPWAARFIVSVVSRRDRIAAAVLLVLCSSCLGRAHIESPYVAITAADVVLFVEGATTCDELKVVEGDIAFESVGEEWGPRWYRLSGLGRFVYEGSTYEVSASGLYRNGRLLDASGRGVILREDGTARFIKPMKVIAH